MKLLYTLLGLSLLGLAFGSFYYTNMRKDVADFKASTSTPSTELIYIYREYGDVSFKNKTSNSYTQVTDDKKVAIPNYSSVKTKDGRGYVIFPDNSSITLSTSTEIEINYTPTKISILQLLGSTYHRVMTLAKGNSYEVRTPNTLAAIRGTKFAVTYNPTSKKTLLAVTEHSVEVTQTKEDGAVVKAPVIIQEGSLAEVKSATSTKILATSTQEGGSVIVRTTSEVPEIKLFIEENKVIDKEYDRTPLDDKKKSLELLIQSLQKESAGSVPPATKEETGATVETRTETITRVVSGIKTDTAPTTSKVITPIIPKETTLVSKTPTTTPTREVLLPTAPISTVTSGLRELPVSAEELTPTDEAFVDTFYTAYERYFLVDDPATYCGKIQGMTANDIVRALLTITNRARIVLPDQTELNAFASDLVTSCADGSIRDKASTLKTRFDSAYPY